MGMEETHWLRRTIPPVLFLFVAAWVAWADARRESGIGDRFERARLVEANGFVTTEKDVVHDS